MIYVLRHGEREDYVDRNWRAKYPDCAPDDPPLAQKGHVQAKEAAQRLANEQIDYIITSPYLRCVETANYVAEMHKKPIFVEPGICEVLWSAPGKFEFETSVAISSSVTSVYFRIQINRRSPQTISSNRSFVQARLSARVSRIMRRRLYRSIGSVR